MLSKQVARGLNHTGASIFRNRDEEGVHDNSRR